MPPKKPIGNIKKNSLPTFKTKELERIYKKLGFKVLEEKHRHIKLRDSQGREIILIKGNKDISKPLLNIIIKEVSEKLSLPKEKVIELFLKYK